MSQAGPDRSLSWGLIGLFGRRGVGTGVTLLPYSASIDRISGGAARRSTATGVFDPDIGQSLISLTSQIDPDRFAGGSTKEDGNS
jgi:hypothetical protein